MMRHGIQGGRLAFAAGDVSARLVVESSAPPERLWRVSVAGANVALRLSWGTCATRIVAGVLPGMVAYFPGAFTVQAELRNPLLPGSASGTLSPVDSVGADAAVVTLSAPGVLPETARHLEVLAPGNISIAGVVVPVVAGQVVGVVDSTVMVTAVALVYHAT